MYRYILNKNKEPCAGLPAKIAYRIHRSGITPHHALHRVLPFMSAPTHTCFECFHSMQPCHWVGLNHKCVQRSQIGNNHCSYIQDPNISMNPVDGSASRELLHLGVH